MVKITYIGDLEATLTQGTSFKKGEPVEVNDEQAIERLSKNKFFKVDASVKTKKKQKKTESKVAPKETEVPVESEG